MEKTCKSACENDLSKYDEKYLTYTVCKTHKPRKLGYSAWHAWAEKMNKRKSFQSQCPVCKFWFFKCEM